MSQRDPLEYVLNRMEAAVLSDDPAGNGYGSARKAGVDAPLYEGTRHSFATRLRQEKERRLVKELGDEMGHADGKMTMTKYAPNTGREEG